MRFDLACSVYVGSSFLSSLGAETSGPIRSTGRSSGVCAAAKQESSTNSSRDTLIALKLYREEIGAGGRAGQSREGESIPLQLPLIVITPCGDVGVGFEIDHNPL